MVVYTRGVVAPATRAKFQGLRARTYDFMLGNTARWDASPVAHFWRQLSRPTFWSYVAANLDANHAASMPIYHRIA